MKGIDQMKRKFLEDLGIEKEAIDKIMAENGRDIENAKADTESLKAELAQAKDTIAERDNQLKELKATAGDNEALTAKITELETTNKEAEAKHKKELNALKINAAVDMALTKSGARTMKAVKALLDMDSIKLDKDGNVTGIDEQIKSLTEGEDTKYLFNTEPFKGASVGNSEGEPTGGKNIDDMTYTEMEAYLAANPDATI